MPSDDILTLPAPPADARLAYGTDPNQFGELRLPKSGGPFPVRLELQRGVWRAEFGPKHTGHLWAALGGNGVAKWNVEYRRGGVKRGGGGGDSEDIGSAPRMQ